MAAQTPHLADLHRRAAEAGIAGYRLLTRDELLAALDSGEVAAEGEILEPAADAPFEEGPGEETEPEREEPAAESRPEEPTVEVGGALELTRQRFGFLRRGGLVAGEEDVYISAAQVRRCELVAGDEVAGPVRAPRRSERYPSLIRVDTINGKSADEVAGEGTKFDDLPAAFPEERLPLGGEDPTVTAIEWLTPFGKGSRVVVAGGPLAGKSDLLRRIAGALSARDGVELTVVLAGVRPEEIGEWGEGIAPVATSPLGSSADSQGQSVEQAVEQGRRVAARGGDAVVVLDTLEQVGLQVARRLTAAARNLADAGSLTVVATVREPIGGETTVVRLDPLLAATGRFPAVSPVQSHTMRSELLVGEKAANKAREERAKSQ